MASTENREITAVDFNQQAENHLAQGRLKDAIAACEAALKIQPDFAGAYRTLAIIWTQQRKPEAAAEFWYQALTLDPTWATADEHLTLGNTLVEQRKLESAIVCYRKAIEFNPNLAVAYHNLGEVLTENKQWESAISCYRQAIQINPDFSGSHCGLGKALSNRGEIEEAIACYRKAIELDPNKASAYQSLADALQGKRLFDEAAINYQRAIELNPDFYWLHHNLGCVFSKLEQWDKAITPYRRASQLNPDFFWSYYNLGYALNQLERWEEAVAAYRQGIALKSDFFWLHNNLGYALLELERFEESVVVYQRAIELNPNFFWSQYKLGDALSQIQQWDEAVSAYLHAIAINPDILGIFSRLGEALRKRSKSGLESAILSYCQAIQRHPETGELYNNVLRIKSESPDFYWQVGEALLKENKFEGAIIFYRMALQVEPENPEIPLQLEQALQKKNEVDIELKHYHSEIELEPNVPTYYSRLGNRLAELGDREEAITLHQKASELRGWPLCAARGYQFTQDWFTHNIAVWQHYLQPLAHQPGVNVVEIGSFQGMSTCWLLDHILTEPTAKITCIDLGFQKQYHPNVAKTKAVDKVIELQGKSQEILPTLAADAYDLAYIDGCHKATSVLEDALLSWKLVKLGGVIIFDDYEWREPETHVQVTKIGIDTFMSVFKNQIEVLHKGYQVIIKKVSTDGNKDTGKSGDIALWVEAYQSLGDLLAPALLEGAESCYQKAIELQPNRGSFHHKLAKVLQDKEEFELAATAYRRAIEIDPNISWSYHNLGDVLLKLEKWEEASIAYRHAIKLNPDFHWSYNNLGTSLSQQEKWEEAIPAYRRAIELNPDFFGSHHHLGDALIKQEKWEEGVAACLRAIELNPEFSWTYQNLGDVLIKQEKWEDAAAAYRRVVELNPEAGWCCQSLGEILEKQEKWEEAAAAYRLGTDLEPDNPWLCKKLGDILQKLGLWDEAIAIYEQGIEIDPKAYFCYEGVGLCLLEKQDWDGAIASFIQALQIKPDLLEVYHKIGYALEQQGELEKSEWGCCEYQMLPLKVLKKYCGFNEDLTVTSELEPSINYISILPADEIDLLPSKSVDIHSIFSGCKYHLPKTFVAVVPEGRAWADVITTAVITSENKLVTDLSTGCAELALISGKLDSVEYIDGTVAFLSVRWGGAAYYHWMFDVIPRFDLLRRSGIDIEAIDKFIVNGIDHPYERETLKTLGIPETKILESSCGLHIQAKNLVVPSNCYQGISQISKWGCEFIKREFLTENSAKTLEKSKRIYISRNLASYRKLVNEEEVLNFLEQWGFESVKLETMSVAEQASCLASAEVIVAPHGAGLTNIVFCSPGTKVIEIFYPTYLPSCYWILSNFGGLEHYYLIGELIERSNSTLPIHQDIKVNLEFLEKLILTYAIM